MPPRTNQRARQLRDQAFSLLQAKVVTREIPPNEEIKTARIEQLLREHDPSLFGKPVLEAIDLLAEHGALIRGEKSFRVVPPDTNRCNALISTRLVAECINVRSLCSSPLQEKLAPIKGIFNDMMQLVRPQMNNEDKLAFVQKDLAFHTAMAHAAGNSALVPTVSHAYYSLIISIHSPLPKFEDADAIVREHESLLAAIAEGNEQLAISKLHIHLSEAVGRWHKDVTDFINNDLRTVLMHLTRAMAAGPVPAHHFNTKASVSPEST